MTGKNGPECSIRKFRRLRCTPILQTSPSLIQSNRCPVSIWMFSGFHSSFPAVRSTSKHCGLSSLGARRRFKSSDGRCRFPDCNRGTESGKRSTGIRSSTSLLNLGPRHCSRFGSGFGNFDPTSNSIQCSRISIAMDEIAWDGTLTTSRSSALSR